MGKTNLFFRAIFLYLGLSIGVHFLTYRFDRYWLDQIYVMQGSLLPTFFMFCTILCMLFMGRRLFSFKMKPFELGPKFYTLLRFSTWGVVAVFFILALYFAVVYDVRFRQTSRLSSDLLVAALFSLAPLTNFIILIFFSKVLHQLSLSWEERSLLLLILIGQVASLNGSSMVPVILVTLGLALGKQEHINWVLTQKIGVGRLTLLAAILCLTLVVVVFVGLATKYGYRHMLQSLMTVEFYKENLGYVPARAAASFISFHNLVNGHLFDLNLEFRSLQENLMIDIKRLHMVAPILPESVSPDFIGGTNRINYLLNYFAHIERAGSSPGLLASFLYLPIFPINLLFLFGYLVIISVIFNSLFPNRNYNILMLSCGLLFIYPLLESPTSYLAFLDPSFGYFALLCLTPFFITYRGQNETERHPIS